MNITLDVFLLSVFNHVPLILGEYLFGSAVPTLRFSKHNPCIFLSKKPSWRRSQAVYDICVFFVSSWMSECELEGIGRSAAHLYEIIVPLLNPTAGFLAYLAGRRSMGWRAIYWRLTCRATLGASSAGC
ncbi:hypothetical protein ACKS0A_10022 [Histoplasma ohiense]